MEPEILTDHAAQDSLEYDLTNNDRRSFDMLEETKRITKGGGYTGNYWTNILARNHLNLDARISQGSIRTMKV